ncbi:unnamed protein product, partial [Brenthis ino]
MWPISIALAMWEVFVPKWVGRKFDTIGELRRKTDGIVCSQKHGCETASNHQLWAVTRKYECLTEKLN